MPEPVATWGALFRAAWHESREEVRQHLVGSLVAFVASLALGGGAGGAEGGLWGALIGGLGGPILAAILLYLYKLCRVTTALPFWRKLIVWVSALGVFVLLVVAARAALPSDGNGSPATPSQIRQAVKEAVREATGSLAETTQPRFEFLRTYCVDGETEFECLEIWNHGERVEDYSLFQFSFLEISRADKMLPGGLGFDHIRYVPAYYFMDRNSTDQLTGLLVTLEARMGARAATATLLPVVNLTEKFEHLEEDIRVEFGENSSMQHKLLIDLDYIDIAGTRRRVMYDLTPYYSFHRPNIPRLVVDRTRIANILALWMLPGVRFWQLTAQEIGQNWDTYHTWDEWWQLGL